MVQLADHIYLLLIVLNSRWNLVIHYFRRPQHIGQYSTQRNSYILGVVSLIITWERSQSAKCLVHLICTARHILPTQLKSPGTMKISLYIDIYIHIHNIHVTRSLFHSHLLLPVKGYSGLNKYLPITVYFLFLISLVIRKCISELRQLAGIAIFWKWVISLLIRTDIYTQQFLTHLQQPELIKNDSPATYFSYFWCSAWKWFVSRMSLISPIWSFGPFRW